MDIEFDYKPFDIHLPFHLTQVNEKAAIGAVGSGKTIALCADAILLGLQQPGSRIMIARQTIPSLKLTTEREFVGLLSSIPSHLDGIQKQTLYDLCKTSKSGGHIQQLWLPNGSEFIFTSLDDWMKHQSLNLAGLYIDEASDVTYDAYTGLGMRLRQQDLTPEAQQLGFRTPITRRVSAICCNPNGHNWVWEHFVRATEQDPSLRATRRYFRSTSFDNPTLYNEDGSPGQYLNRLLGMPDLWVRRFVLCEFDAFAGQIYPFSSEYHVHQDFDPPPDWERACGLDWGLRNPTAIVWWARDPKDGKWYQYREWQSYDSTDSGAREAHQTMTVHQVISTMKRLEGNEVIRWRVIDPSTANRQADSGKSVLHYMREAGLYFVPGVQNYETRINSLGQMIHRNEISFAASNHMTQIAVQQYRWEDMAPGKDKDGPERPQKKNDHLVNAAEYLATHFMVQAPIKEEPTIPTHDDMIWSGVKAQIAKQMKRHKYSTY